MLLQCSQAVGKLYWSARASMVRMFGVAGGRARGMLKKTKVLTRPPLADISPSRPESAKAASSPWDAPCPKQGRSDRRAEEVHAALRLNRSPTELILANGRTPTAISTSWNILRYVKGPNDAGTKLADLVSILLKTPIYQILHQ